MSNWFTSAQGEIPSIATSVSEVSGCWKYENPWTVKSKTKSNEKGNSKIKKNITKRKKQTKNDGNLSNNNIENEIVQDNENIHSEEKTGWWS